MLHCATSSKTKHNGQNKTAIPKKNKRIRCLPSLSFSGCGLHVYFQLGVANELLSSKVRTDTVLCTSAGMCSALYYLLDLRKCLPLQKLLDVLPVCSPLPQAGKPSLLVAKGCCTNQFCPNLLQKSADNMIELVCRVLSKRPDSYKRLNNRLFVFLCRWPSLKTTVVSCWKSNEHVIETLKQTTTIPWVTRPGPYCCGNEKWVDGGFLNTHPIKDCHTVCVTNSRFSAFSKARRCKKQWWGEISHPLCTDSACLVRDKKYYKDLYKLGKCTAKNYLNRCCL